MATIYERQRLLPVSAAEAFAWHERRGALERLIPPWENVTVLRRGDGLRDGTMVELAQRVGPLRLKWVARHDGFRPGESFRDVQVSGPFARWEHMHAFEPRGDGQSLLTDHIEYDVPAGRLGRSFCGRFIRRKIDTMFTYRHNVTHDDLTAHAKHSAAGLMRIAVSGAGGLVGSALVPMLTTGGHEVTRLVRREANEGEVHWDPEAPLNTAPLEGIDGVVHLAGANIAASRWTDGVKERIRRSRVIGTGTLCSSLAAMQRPPKVLVCASAVGIYGDRGDAWLDEASSAGEGFLAEVARQWEAATQAAREAGIRVVQMRFGMILSPQGGALSKMLMPFKVGAGGRVGNGRQYWSWLSIDDAVGAIHHALMTESLSGPVNGVSPNPVTNKEFTQCLARVLRRPSVMPLPARAMRLALGEMADHLLLASLRVKPARLMASEYDFRHTELEAALRHVLGQTDERS